jgi:hypothetical protein
MKYIFLFIFIAFMAASPVYMFESFVLPELASLESSYENYEQISHDVASGKPIASKP